MTDGSAYVMTFTELLSLKSQAVYDAVEKVGSLVARIVLTPLEEMCFAYFSNTINKNSKVFTKSTDSHDSLVENFSVTLHVASVVGIVVSVFRNTVFTASSAVLLSLYCIYLSVMAVNGITECFAMASMSNAQVFSHGGFLFISAIVHLVLSFVLCSYLNASGFIIANAVNMIFRIGYSWRHTKSFLGDRTPSIASIFPTFSTLVFLFFSLMATLFTLLVFGSTPGLSHTLAHVAVGGVFLVLVVAHIVSTDYVFQMLTHRLQKYAP
ncbi:Rft protein [Oesophagostomum dentatum]|uniref:Protein RFT1 homolog n=1 Tax=Oesophagostomum dentatum TaxID=61180 RepID=A0A0B1RT25_OESDE|nr:Rft protein [Oesophagostomum dentatum]